MNNFKYSNIHEIRISLQGWGGTESPHTAEGWQRIVEDRLFGWGFKFDIKLDLWEDDGIL